MNQIDLGLPPEAEDIEKGGEQMDNQQEKKKGGEKMNEPKQTEVGVKSKVNVAQSIGIAIAALAIIGGITGAAFALFSQPQPPAADTGVGCTTQPSNFTLTTPAAGAIDVNRNGGHNSPIVDLTLKWGAASGASGYKVYLAKYPNTPILLATVTTTSYTLATPIDFSTKYSWKIVAYKSGCGSKTNTGGQRDFTTLAAPPAAYNPVAYDVAKAAATQAACGANRVCISESPSRDIVTCAEYQAIWSSCLAVGNNSKCPENLADQCKEMTICQCGTYDQGSKLGQMIPPGGQDCANFNDLTFTGNADLSGPFVNPCAP